MLLRQFWVSQPRGSAPAAVPEVLMKGTQQGRREEDVILVFVCVTCRMLNALGQGHIALQQQFPRLSGQKEGREKK